MGTYRFEEASTSRATCTNKECKDEKIKIKKGELRLGTWVEIGEFQSFHWRHWGCVTPRIIANINDSLGENKDYTLLDGYDELSEENQAKVRKALEQGHVDDSEWRGDVELNRPGKNGFRLRAKTKEETEDKANETKEEKPKAKKRGRGDQDDEETEDVPTKKAKKEKSSKKTAAKDDAAEANPAKRGRPRKNPEAVAEKPEQETEDASKKAEDAPKKAGRGRKKKVVENENDNASADADADVNADADANGADNAEPKPSKKGRKAAATDAEANGTDNAEPKSSKRGRKPKAATAAAEATEQGETETAPAKPKRGRPKKTTTSDE
ncbi:hypothetical protein VTN77DRAFT_8159 [Rasamsonia byssochlamydoides]|uniref:uncharacterized protein n=1 Tax=Rasamsonia byssochlamydoides TaxID=89139 RepID=UPI0037422AB1